MSMFPQTGDNGDLQSGTLHNRKCRCRTRGFCTVATLDPAHLGPKGFYREATSSLRSQNVSRWTSTSTWSRGISSASDRLRPILRDKSFQTFLRAPLRHVGWIVGFTSSCGAGTTSTTTGDRGSSVDFCLRVGQSSDHVVGPFTSEAWLEVCPMVF